MPGSCLEAEGKLASLLVRGAKIAIYALGFSRPSQRWRLKPRSGMGNQVNGGRTRPERMDALFLNLTASVKRGIRLRRDDPYRYRRGLDRSCSQANLHHMHNRKGRLCAV